MKLFTSLQVKKKGLKRQLYDDIRFMESEQGWSIELEKQKTAESILPL